MRKYIHTALVILAVPCFGQFTDIWTNIDYFAVDQMSSQCYSASVERCVAVGVTPDAPSWWDYILGKNYAKLSSVKANIKAVRPYFVNSLTNALDLLKARDSAAWTSNPHFLLDCRLPTNSLDETPYFKSQYPNVTGGWYHTWIMLTNMTVSEDPGEYTPVSGNQNQWYGSSTNQPIYTNWVDAYSDIYWASFTNQASGYIAYSPNRYSSGFFDGLSYGAEAMQTYAKLGYSGLSTTLYRNATAYHKGGAALYWEDFFYPDIMSTNMIFNSQSTSVSNGWWQVGTIAYTNAASMEGIGIGIDGSLTNDPGIPDFAASVASELPYVNTYGWQTFDEKIILNWAVTNGFKFR